MAIDWPVSKDPDEIIDLVHDWSARIGADTIAEVVATEIAPAGTTQPVAVSFTPSTTTLWLSGGDVGATAIYTVRVTTTGGRVLEESFRVAIIDSAVVDATPTEIESLKAALVDVRAAILRLASGEQIKEVWRDGRRIVKVTMTYNQLRDLEAAYLARIAELEASAAYPGRRRRFGIPVAFG